MPRAASTASVRHFFYLAQAVSKASTALALKAPR